MSVCDVPERLSIIRGTIMSINHTYLYCYKLVLLAAHSPSFEFETSLNGQPNGAYCLQSHTTKEVQTKRHIMSFILPSKIEEVEEQPI